MDIILKKKPWYVKYRYYIMAAVAFAAVFAYAIIVALAPRQMRVDDGEIVIAEVKEGKFLEYVDVEGLVQPIMTLKVNSTEDGYVSEIRREEGCMLSKGDTILVLTNPELMRTIDDEQDEWERQQRTYREQEIEMQQRTITLRQQSLDAEYEMQSLDKRLSVARDEFRMGIKSRAELDVAEEEYLYKKRKTELQMQSLRHDSVMGQLRQELIRGDMERADKNRIRTLARTAGLVVTAPCDGQLSYLSATLGQQIGRGSAIGEIKVMSDFKIRATLNEYYIDRMVAGLPANITYQDQDFPLRVSRVVPEIKDRIFSVELTSSQTSPDGGRQVWPDNFRIGKSYRVKIELGRPESALVVQRGDFYGITGGMWIYRVSDDGTQAVRVPITIGRQNPRQYEITSGLHAGDRVIVSGYEKLGDVERVCIK